MKKKIVIVGAGAAGIGIGIVLQKMGLDFIILEKGVVGQSFLQWSAGTRFISPSFAGNYFGMPDLNAVCPDTSLAYTFETEHPTGKEYAHYLQSLVQAYNLPVQINTLVSGITKSNCFCIKTKTHVIESDFVIWAGGEYQFPKTEVCEGAHFGVHNSKISDYAAFQNKTVPIVGGYESGFDTALQLAAHGVRSVVFDSQNYTAKNCTDASYSLSPYTKDRIKQYASFIEVKPYTRVKKISKHLLQYQLETQSGDCFLFDCQPILATGFLSSLTQVQHLFNWQQGGPELTSDDESTKTSGLFLVGPQVTQNNIMFCFVYKFRQRFAVLAQKIAADMGIQQHESVQKVLQLYQQNNFYLKDITCCEQECIC